MDNFSTCGPLTLSFLGEVPVREIEMPVVLHVRVLGDTQFQPPIFLLTVVYDPQCTLKTHLQPPVAAGGFPETAYSRLLSPTLAHDHMTLLFNYRTTFYYLFPLSPQSYIYPGPSSDPHLFLFGYLLGGCLS